MVKKSRKIHLKKMILTMESFMVMIWMLKQTYGKVESCSNGQLSEVCYTGDYYSTSEFPLGPKPTSVNISVWLKDIVNINEEKQSATIFITMGIQWEDQRLSVNQNDADLKSDRHWYSMKTSDITEVWSPMFYLMNSLDVKRHGSYGGEITNSFWYNHPYRLDYKEVLYITLSCNMNFELFPYDFHTCFFQMRSWNGASDNVKFEKPILYIEEIEKDTKQDEICIISTKLNFDVCIKAEDPMLSLNQVWPLPLAQIRIILQRNRGSFNKVLIGFYAPTGIFAFMSMISFAISPEMVPGRMGMLVTLYLILINTYSSMDAPSKRGFSFADVWFVGCQAPIAFAILEYGTILIFLRSQKISGADKWIKILDTFSSLLAMLYFIAFNLSYWCYFTK